MRLYDYFIDNRDLINHLESIAINKGYSFFKYKDYMKKEERKANEIY